MQQVEQQIRKFKRESESAGKAKTANVTMYDLLKESCHVTEQVNAASLKHLLEREEEAKRRHSAQSRKHFLGPKVKYHSYKGEDGLARNEFSFLDGAEPPSTSARSINAKPPSNPTCAVTGRPAKYKDPATGLHYSDANAFKAVRANKQKHLEQQPNPAVIVQVGGSSGSSAKPKAGLLKLKIKPPRLVVKPPTN
jgi:vacuolar protein sorting-associated protein 72